MLIKLKCFSHTPGAKGVPNQVIDAPDDVAQSFIDRGGATAAEPEAEQPSGTSDDDEEDDNGEPTEQPADLAAFFELAEVAPRYQSAIADASIETLEQLKATDVSTIPGVGQAAADNITAALAALDG